ncbi:hypothetical protein HanRHA438_Chr15g0722531 [Helianthus annuus]|nr:hypothetical protein HanHA300_Chr15g0579221 [Helianthus annuus]KAJ0649922.1 hypothetical protein HanLR1_Chr15g0589781 [Helianthus annuus]KAJ0653710.1 hypothetical protein HanOQP8_Chr15g0586591 [Helianthus annuus]KAJ0832705.1 hypothetical protein HanPSC8_Chr15g0681741 [Helianthus annuus]KAJ0846232.1 hypothetical protein HanRHA438_Chr15g0722531 [Helianthus annuus]
MFESLICNYFLFKFNQILVFRAVLVYIYKNINLKSISFNILSLSLCNLSLTTVTPATQSAQHRVT